MLATAAAAVVATALPGAARATDAGGRAWQDVVVTGSGAEGAASAVTAVGGQVVASLPLVRGVAARLPAGATLGDQWLVAPQRELRVAAAPAALTDGPASTVRATLGLPANGDEGRGVTVAVVDTGIADVPDLAGRVARRIDITGSGGGDGYGHGTFMAGLIAGSGAASGGAYRGVAPAAKLVDVKVADADGRTDLITVLRGLQWVSQNARDVKVLNLSLSSNSPLPYQIDPLTQALEALWRRGVTVVVPSGNDGPGTGSVTSPGSDPVLLTAGGLDESGTAQRRDDVVATWSGRGPSWQGDAKPDLVAPGARVVSLRSPGSVVDAANPQARIGGGYFRGSGTSMATAVTSGVAAVVLAEEPKLRPDAVKNLFTATAYSAPGLSRAAGAGAGGLDAARALDAASEWRKSPSQAQFDRDTAAIGRDAKDWAALEEAILAGDRAAAAAAWAKLSAGSRDWAARAWVQLDPATRDWAARAWVTEGWGDGPDGTAEQWAARAWVARAWVARAWVSDEWAARAWVNGDWSARAWVARAWVSQDWAARAWVSDKWSARAWTWQL
ncbi:S8 family serine peptidase [Micromonospora pattaloongensis]|uniref:S8 family serine peptidase n=1 Tax=Micromonospora pattaloongensis TaxID=405436 RepID=UPI00158798F9|nr:S8 family serine peptidase [Micromonospora pattaloongensis]